MHTSFFYIFLILLVSSCNIKKQTTFDVRYYDIENVEQSSINTKIYVFSDDRYKLETIGKTSDMGLINLSLKNDKFYYLLAVDKNIRGNLYETVETLGELLSYMGDTSYVNEICDIALLFNERGNNNSLFILHEIDDKAVEIAKRINLEKYPELKHIFDLEYSDTDNIKGKLVLMSDKVNNTHNFFYLQRESELHIY